jgi:restriction endonuclease
MRAAQCAPPIAPYELHLAEPEVRTLKSRSGYDPIADIDPHAATRHAHTMNSIYRDWREYQEAVAAFFKERGCTASVEARITGARAEHRIDVYVTLRQHGIECRWIVECKLWKKHVEKENVLTLKAIVEDVGADRGIIFCENGFQAGARDATRYTNILLVTSLDEFKRTVSLNEARTALVYQDSNQPGAPPIHAFPNKDQPQHLLSYGARVFVANWQTGNIAVVDPATKSIESVIHLDKYEAASNSVSGRAIRQYLPGDMACADGKLFVGQVFSEFVLAIDIDTQSIVRRIMIPGGGEGAIAASHDGRYIYFASNRANRLFIIDSATYEYQEVDYPAGGRGSMCVLSHPSKPLVYVGIQRGGSLNGRSYFGGNCFLATYDLTERRYVGHLYLAEVENGRSDDSTPACLTFDEEDGCLFVGMFQSQRGICRIDEHGRKILANFRFAPNATNRHFVWVDPLSQALYRDRLLSVNRNNCELVILDKHSGRIESATFLGDAPNGPRAVVVVDDIAIISYPERQGLIFHSLGPD